MNKNERFVTRSFGLACYADLASSEATINEVSRGCIKTGKGEESFLRPLLKREKVREGLGSPSSFILPGTSSANLLACHWRTGSLITIIIPGAISFQFFFILFIEEIVYKILLQNFDIISGELVGVV